MIERKNVLNTKSATVLTVTNISKKRALPSSNPVCWGGVEYRCQTWHAKSVTPVSPTQGLSIWNSFRTNKWNCVWTFRHHQDLQNHQMANTRHCCAHRTCTELSPDNQQFNGKWKRAPLLLTEWDQQQQSTLQAWRRRCQDAPGIHKNQTQNVGSEDRVPSLHDKHKH